MDQNKVQEPKIIGTMTIADDLFSALDCDDPYLKACANAYYEVLIAGTSLRDPKLNKVCKKFKDALEKYNARLRSQLEELQTTKGQGQSLFHQLHGCEDMQANSSSKINDLTLIPGQEPAKEDDMASQRSNPRET